MNYTLKNIPKLQITFQPNAKNKKKCNPKNCLFMRLRKMYFYKVINERDKLLKHQRPIYIFQIHEDKQLYKLISCPSKKYMAVNKLKKKNNFN